MPDEVTEIAVWDTPVRRKCGAGQRNLEFGMPQRVESAEQVIGQTISAIDVLLTIKYRSYKIYKETKKSKKLKLFRKKPVYIL